MILKVEYGEEHLERLIFVKPDEPSFSISTGSTTFEPGSKVSVALDLHNPGDSTVANGDNE